MSSLNSILRKNIIQPFVILQIHKKTVMPPFLIMGLGICFVLNLSLLVDDCASDHASHPVHDDSD